jgi:hypothetical protein
MRKRQIDYIQNLSRFEATILAVVRVIRMGELLYCPGSLEKRGIVERGEKD